MINENRKQKQHTVQQLRTATLDEIENATNNPYCEIPTYHFDKEKFEKLATLVQLSDFRTYSSNFEIANKITQKTVEKEKPITQFVGFSNMFSIGTFAKIATTNQTKKLIGGYENIKNKHCFIVSHTTDNNGISEIAYSVFEIIGLDDLVLVAKLVDNPNETEIPNYWAVPITNGRSVIFSIE